MAIFSRFKVCLRILTEIYIVETGNYSVTKEQAVKMTSNAWKSSNMEENIVTGFKGCVLFPPTQPILNKCVSVFHRNGAPKDTAIAAWLRIKPVIEKDVLVLQTPRKRVRKTATVGGRLLTRDLLCDLASPPATAKRKKTQ